MAISALGEGCHDQMTPMLSQIVDAILPFLADPHPRVRYASCNALGQMATGKKFPIVFRLFQIGFLFGFY